MFYRVADLVLVGGLIVVPATGAITQEEPRATSEQAPEQRTAAPAGPIGGLEEQIGEEAQAMMEAWQRAATPGAEHALLADKTGVWRTTATTFFPSGERAVIHGEVERSMILNGRVLEERATATAMGQPFESVEFIGFDNLTDSYWSTYSDSHSTGVVVARGSLDENGEGSFFGEVSDPVTGDQRPFRIEIDKRADLKETRTYFTTDASGEEVRWLEIVYCRCSDCEDDKCECCVSQ